MSQIVKIGGVPEHFNYPWHVAIEGNWFKEKGIELQWTDYPNGTGAMCADLKAGKLDLALVLTEGIVADISKGNPASLIMPYVISPLLWGIHVPYTSDIRSEEDIQGRKIAISRFGSGSHLMAYVDAMKRGWDTSGLEFVLAENLEGARKAFREGRAEVFFWEKFTTHPLVEQKEFRLAGVRPTPWPCFHLAGRNEFIESNKEIITDITRIIIKAVKAVKNDSDKSILEIARRYQLNVADIRKWFAVTQWSESDQVDQKMIGEVSGILKTLGLIGG
jgi:sulfonate transport system substrate-binding protein